MYERVQKPNSSWSPTFHQEKSESLFRPRPFSIQPQADTEASQEQEIPAYSRAARDAISAKLFQSMGGGVQTQAQTESQKPESEGNPAFEHQKSESFFRPRPLSIQPQADTEASQEQEIPAYSRADRDAISAKLFKPMGGDVQSQAETETQKPKSEESPAFHHHNSESFFRPRPFSIQPQADTEASQKQEIPAYSRVDRDAIWAKLLKSMGGNVQTQAEAESQKPESEPEEKADEMSNEAVSLQRLSESGESGDEDDNSPNGGTIQRVCDKCESQLHGERIEEEKSDAELSPQGGAIHRKEESSESEDDEMNPVQAKLTIGAPGDKYEQEADQMAERVMSMEAQANPQSVQRQSESEKDLIQKQPLAVSISPLIQRFSESAVQTKPSVQRTGESGASPATPSLENRLASEKGSGSPLDNQTRSFMESRFGNDFSGVRVHTDSSSVSMNKELGAQAFTHGNDIYFNSGKYNPGSSEGKKLLAHELTHTIQQTGAVQAKLQPGEKHEQETEQMAEPAKDMPAPVKAKGAEVEAEAQSSNQPKGKLEQQTQPAPTTETKPQPEVTAPQSQVAPAPTTETKPQPDVATPKPEVAAAPSAETKPQPEFAAAQSQVAPAPTTETKPQPEVAATQSQVAPAPTVPGGETQQLPQEKIAESPANTEQKTETGNIGAVGIQVPDLSQADQGTSLTDMWQQQQAQMNNAGGDVAQNIDPSQEPKVALEQALQQSKQKIASIPQQATDVQKS